MKSFPMKQYMKSFPMTRAYSKLSDLPKVICLAWVRVKGALSPVLFPLFLAGNL